jgi:hypothetical protein
MLWFIFSFVFGSTLAKRWAKAFLVVVSVSTSAASSGVVALLGGVCWDASCLVFVFQVETCHQFFGGATTTASAPFPS